MNNVIFLDIDGVLNCSTTTETIGGNSSIMGVEPAKVALLRELVEETNAIIVLISSWKDGWNKENKSYQDSACTYLEAMLAAECLEIEDATLDNWTDRGYGIATYLDENDVDAWVVLDDEIFEDYEEYDIMPHLVQTSFEDRGLTPSLVNDAIDIMDKQRYKKYW